MINDITDNNVITETLKREFPELQAVYLFGSYGTPDENECSDVDVAVLLPPDLSKAVSLKRLFEVRCILEATLLKNVDLVNLREVNTVFQKEIIKDGRRIFCADFYASEVFEMLTISFYQKLNEERAGILNEIEQSGRVFA